MSDADMRHAIMLNVKANGIPITGEFWITLAFRTTAELRAICADMNIAVRA